MKNNFCPGVLCRQMDLSKDKHPPPHPQKEGAK